MPAVRRYEQWIADHMTDEQAAETLLGQFKRAVGVELELLTVEATDVDPASPS